MPRNGRTKNVQKRFSPVSSRRSRFTVLFMSPSTGTCLLTWLSEFNFEVESLDGRLTCLFLDCSAWRFFKDLRQKNPLALHWRARRWAVSAVYNVFCSILSIFYDTPCCFKKHSPMTTREFQCWSPRLMMTWLHKPFQISLLYRGFILWISIHLQLVK